MTKTKSTTSQKQPAYVESKEFLKIVELYALIFKEIEGKIETLAGSSKEDIQKAVEKLEKTVDNALQKIESRKFRNGKDGRPGKDGKDGKDGKSISLADTVRVIRRLIPAPIPGKDADESRIIDKIEKNLPQLGAAMRDGLELLKVGEKIKIGAIENLTEELDEIKKEVRAFLASNSGTGRNSTIPRRTFIRKVSLTSQVNGSTQAFTLPIDTMSVIGIFSTQFPVTFDESDWTFSGRTLTLSSSIGPIQEGQTLWALIETI